MKASRSVMLILAALVTAAGIQAHARRGPLATSGPIDTSFDLANFTTPVANPYFPLMPVTTYFYESQTDEGRVRTETTVTADTKPIMGLNAIVVHDVVWLDVAGGPTVLIEDTLDWYAPDNFGNIWYMGESTVEHLYDGAWNEIGTSTEGSWLAGFDGAVPGIIMLANPQPGVSYRQEFSQGVAEDMAKVLRLNATVSVPYGDYENALVTKEWTQLDPGSIEQKFYKQDVGLVLVQELKGKGTVNEKLVDIHVTAP
jgi:hypothetical protein